MNLQEQLCDWENIRLAYQNASRGKRGRGATAAFEILRLFEAPLERLELSLPAPEADALSAELQGHGKDFIISLSLHTHSKMEK